MLCQIEKFDQQVVLGLRGKFRDVPPVGVRLEPRAELGFDAARLLGLGHRRLSSGIDRVREHRSRHDERRGLPEVEKIRDAEPLTPCHLLGMPQRVRRVVKDRCDLERFAHELTDP